MENNYEKIIFEADDGDDIEFYVLEQTMLAGVNYLLVTDDLEDDEAGFMILKETKEDEEGLVAYDVVEDDSELKSVIGIFNELVDDFDLEV